MLVIIMMAGMISDIKRLMRNAKNKGLNKELLFFTQLKIFIRSIVKTFWEKSFAGRVKLQKQLLSCLLQDRFCQKKNLKIHRKHLCQNLFFNKN